MPAHCRVQAAAPQAGCSQSDGPDEGQQWTVAVVLRGTAPWCPSVSHRGTATVPPPNSRRWELSPPSKTGSCDRCIGVRENRVFRP